MSARTLGHIPKYMDRTSLNNNNLITDCHLIKRLYWFLMQYLVIILCCLPESYHLILYMCDCLCMPHGLILRTHWVFSDKPELTCLEFGSRWTPLAEDHAYFEEQPANDRSILTCPLSSDSWDSPCISWVSFVCKNFENFANLYHVLLECNIHVNIMSPLRWHYTCTFVRIYIILCTFVPWFLLVLMLNAYTEGIYALRIYVAPRSRGYRDATATYIRRSEKPSRISLSISTGKNQSVKAQW